MGESKFEFSIDRGGTFTDVYAVCPNGKIRTMKLLSVDPNNYPDAPREAIRRILEEETGVKMPPSEPINTSWIGSIRMGTTVATNALLERKGERMALAVTQGFRDLLHIGNQARPDIFDLEIKIPELLYEEVIEVEERVTTTNSMCSLKHDWTEAAGTTGEKVWVCQPINQDRLRKDLQQLFDKGIKSLAVVLLHSYMFPNHEQLVGKLAEEVGFTNVSLSSQVMPMVRAVPRGFTAAADAYLTPCIKKYLQNFSSGFKDNLKNVNVLFMQSDGGLTPMKSFSGSRAILSGPAGGVVGYSVTSFKKDTELPVIGFDMGGTSTDVSRFAGEYEHVFESITAGITMQAPQLDVNTVAAGGGSMLFFRSGLFTVGPESAGAHPGPVCYRKGGPLAVTDANLCLGRLLPEYFPKIFGPNEDEPLDKNGSLEAMEKITAQVNYFMKGQNRSVEEVALGFIQVANEAMCRPIRALTQAKGYDTRRHTLSCFGGAGGQHACSIARALGMHTVLIHKYAGILSAYGIALADVVHEAQEPCSRQYTPDSFDYIDDRLSELSSRCVTALQNEGFSRSQISIQTFLHLRYDRTDCAIMIPPQPADSRSPKHGDFHTAFLQRYKQEFGFTIPDRPIIIDDIRIRGAGSHHVEMGISKEESTETPPKEKVVQMYFSGGWRDANVYMLDNMRPGCQVKGPAIIMDNLSTIVVEPDCTAGLTHNGNVIIEIGTQRTYNVSKEMDPIQLSLFSHRFMSLAEQMGRILQRTSVSTNIKERLDFSCALFGPNGGLVSNAPHIPVHLGAMQETVQYQLKMVGAELKDGDVILSNHPSAGGSHLPDLTVITPVFIKGNARPIFFVACRGHHADIGGITPGSMPPYSTHINQEGVVFKSFFLVREGRFQEKEVIAAFNEAGTRNLSDNLSDLRAQVAANQRGITLVQELIEEYTLEVVQAYMGYIQHNAELAVRDLLVQSASRLKRSELKAEDYMDDGSVIKLSVDIDTNTRSAVFDFSGTGPEVWGNCNAPKAVTMSAVIYCLRSLVGYDIPLNQGCLNPVKVIIPSGSLLCPSEEAAVVGGNVLTSQRVVDVVIKAFRACAASQGCMNNVTIGDENWGYYETVAGGAGAGPGWNGRGGIHTHMTNTRITDAEILERRYPVLLKAFHLKKGSGGLGKWIGGEAIEREMLFRAPLTLCILTERRVFAPFGMEGGHPGSKGMNLLIKSNGKVIYLGGKTTVPVQPGDAFRLLSPGGGGYGHPE